MPLDAWREGDAFVLEFDLPGVQPETLDIDVERNELTVRAERSSKNGNWEMLAAERPTGLFTVSWSWATTSTWTGSRPVTTTACSG